MHSSNPATLMVGQSGGPTAVINATLAGVLKEARRHPSIGRVLGMRHGIEGALQGKLVDLTSTSEAEIACLGMTPGAALGSCRYKVTERDYEALLSLFRRCNVRYFLYIGGNDSMDTCHKISELARREGYELAVVGLPKTIDNDLAVTDHSPGYGSAARYVALATMEAGKDLEAMSTFDDVSILEVMGRNAGWLTAASALGRQSHVDPPHLVYVPERPFDVNEFLEAVRTVHKELGYVFVAVSEGIRDRSGRLVASLGGTPQRDAFGHELVTLSTGVGFYLATMVARELGLQARANRPGTLQRSCSSLASRVDREEAEWVGMEGVKRAVEQVSDVMITLERQSSRPYRCELGVVPLSQVANAEKVMPADFVTPDGLGVTEAFVEYALPLIGDPLPAYFPGFRG